MLADAAETTEPPAVRLFLCLVGWAVGLAGGLRGQALLEPPFGLLWGDSPEKLIAWAGRHSLDVTIRMPGAQPALRVVRIEPKSGFLPDTRANAVEGRFLNGGMYELTIHYADPEASADLTLSRFEELRKEIGTKHGALTANREERTVADQFATRTRAFHREPVKGLFLLLALTEVEDLLRKTTEARFSLVYRNDNLRAELEAAARGDADAR
jgi:hypothetical protein